VIDMKKIWGVIFLSIIIVSSVLLCVGCKNRNVQGSTETSSYSKHGSSEYLEKMSPPETVDEQILERVTGLAEGETGLAEESDIDPEYKNSQGDANYVPSDSDDLVEIARGFIDCLNIVQILNGCSLETDPSTVIKYGDYNYELVTDERFQSLSDIQNFLNTYFTRDFIESDCYYILGLGEKDYYIEVKENNNNIIPGLYQMVNDNGYYQFNPEQAIVVSHSNEPKFSASTNFYDDGDRYNLLYKCIYDSGWKVDRVFINADK